MTSYTVSCPICKEKTVEISVEEDRKYGANRDGNFGVSALFCEFESQTCECELEEFDLEACYKEAMDLFDE